jgi:DNA repair exonuclease SbcCD nuclease subunit
VSDTRLGIIGDAHLGCANYSDKRRADFVAAFCNAVRTCLREECSAICLLGDVFDSDVMRRNVDAFAEAIAGISPALAEVRKAKVPLLAIAGNHEFGRGRLAGELRVLESLGFVRVLQGEEVVIDGVGIAGIPWHQPEDLSNLRSTADRLAKSSKAARRVLLLHNYVAGSARIPQHLWEIESPTAAGFDRVFVGHHHDREEVGPFVIPGATEVQDIREADTTKSVVVYDVERGRHTFHSLPRTRDVVVLKYDAAEFDRYELLRRLRSDLDSRGVDANTFVCVRVAGMIRTGAAITRAEISALFRERDLFDRYIELQVSTKTKEVKDVMMGASIDHLLRKRFPNDERKAREYIEACTASDFAVRIRDRIVS